MNLLYAMLPFKFTRSLDEPNIWPNSAAAIVTLWHPRVVLMDHTVLLSPPVHGCRKEDQTEHPPANGDLHAVKLAQVIEVGVGALRSTLFESVPEGQLHDFAVLRPMDATASENPVLRDCRAIRIGDWS